jgi:hypothetical protein
MTIEEIIKQAFSRGWNASHECATDFDYDCALNGFLSEVETEVKKFRIGAVSGSVCTCLNAQTEKYSQVPVYCHNCKAYVQTVG